MPPAAALARRVRAAAGASAAGALCRIGPGSPVSREEATALDPNITECLSGASGAELRLVQQLLEILCEGIDEGVVLLDQHGAPCYASTAGRRLLGVPGDGGLEAAWRPVRELLGGPVSAPSRAALGDLSFRVHPIPDPDDPRRVPLHLVMVGDRRREASRHSALLLASRMQALMGFYRASAHDLKTPLNALILNLELLRKSLAADPGPRGEDRLALVEVLATELARLQRLAQGALEHGQPHREELDAFDLRRLAREVAALVRPQAQRQGVSVEVVSTARPLHVLAVRDRLQQALLNLVINALEAMPGGGSIALELAAAEHGTIARDAPPAGLARLVVRDDGPGIPPGELHDVLKPHVTTKASGTGIGLPVARQIVEDCGGSLTLASELERGTRVTLLIPLSREACADAPDAEAGDA